MLAPLPQENLRNTFTPNEEDWFVKLTRQVNFGAPPSTTQQIIATRAIQPTNPLVRIISATAGVVDITADPQIVNGFDGQELTLEGLDNTKTVKLDNGNGLQLAGGASFTLGNGDILKLHYNQVRNIWIENYRSNN